MSIYSLKTAQGSQVIDFEPKPTKNRQPGQTGDKRLKKQKTKTIQYFLKFN